MGAFRSTLKRCFVSLAAGVLVLVMQPAKADQIALAVASNFLNPARSLAKAFEKETGHRVRISAGSTGKLYAQIVNGAPFDVFLAANDREPARLEEQGLAVPGSRFTYAVGRLVLWSADPETIQEDGAALLKGLTYHRLAIANPRTAPYGAAAMAVLDALGITEQVAPKLIRAENIGQAFQFAASGNADLGMVALSQVNDPNNPIAGSRWRVPEGLYPPIRQQAVLLTRAENNSAASMLLSFLRGPAAESVIEAYGYGIEPSSGSKDMPD